MTPASQRSLEQEKSPSSDANLSFDGFDIPLSDNDSTRIDRLVNDYESRIISHLNEDYVRHTRRSDRIADKIAAFGGSWRFISLFGGFLAVWIIWNTIQFAYHFDPPPFILLNLLLSFVAAFQAPIIMMSQNRQAARDKHESIIDFAINYRAGREVDDMQGHLHRMEEDIAAVKNMLQELRASQGNGASTPPNAPDNP